MLLDAERLLELFQKTSEDLLPLEYMNLYEYLGNFIPLWFRPEAVRRVEEETKIRFEQPQLPQDRGSCWIIFALGSATQYPLLKPAFVLPLQWQQKPEHDQRLPSRLIQLADRVRRELSRAYRDEKYLRWRLYIHPNFASSETMPDFSGLNDQLRFESGWLALAGGLYLAQHNGQPDEHVWASARWDEERGITRIGHLREKLALARQYGVQQFYIPAEQINEVPDSFRDMVQPVPQGTIRVEKVLDSYVRALDVMPACRDSSEQSFQRCRDWYMRQPHADLDYYCTVLLPYIVPKLQQQFRLEYPDCRPEVLVTILSYSWNLVPLIARVFQVRRCIALYTGQDQTICGYKNSLASFLQDNEQPVELQFQEFSEGGLPESFRSLAVWNEYRNCPDDILVDTTPGKKLMTLHLYEAAPRGCWFVYVNTEQNQGARAPRPEPGSERLVCWQHD